MLVPICARAIGTSRAIDDNTTVTTTSLLAYNVLRNDYVDAKPLTIVTAGEAAYYPPGADTPSAFAAGYGPNLILNGSSVGQLSFKPYASNLLPGTVVKFSYHLLTPSGTSNTAWVTITVTAPPPAPALALSY